MFEVKQWGVRVLSSFVYLLRRREFQNADVRFVVVTGSVGKTIMRRTIAKTLSTDGLSVSSLDTDYVNELGVILSILSLQSFSVWSLKSWSEVLRTKSQSGRIVLIELGADFRLDIDWFVRRWTPWAVVFTMGTDVDWTGSIQSVLSSRVKLAKTAGEDVFVSADDRVHQELLTSAGVAYKTLTSDGDIFSYPCIVAKRVADRLGQSASTCVPYKEHRFSMDKTQSAVIITDMYKVTPLCLQYCLDRLLSTKNKTKVLVMSEMRPLPKNYEEIYAGYLAQLEKVDEVYCIGSRQFSEYLQSLMSVEFISSSRYRAFSEELRRRAQTEDIAVCVKTSRVYSFPEI